MKLLWHATEITHLAAVTYFAKLHMVNECLFFSKPYFPSLSFFLSPPQVMQSDVYSGTYNTQAYLALWPVTLKHLEGKNPPEIAVSCTKIWLQVICLSSPGVFVIPDFKVLTSPQLLAFNICCHFNNSLPWKPSYASNRSGKQWYNISPLSEKPILFKYSIVKCN